MNFHVFFTFCCALLTALVGVILSSVTNNVGGVCIALMGVVLALLGLGNLINNKFDELIAIKKKDA